MVGSLKYFDLIYVMTGGGPGTATELMATYMYKESFKNLTWVMAQPLQEVCLS